jgi:putative heme-binding domain-containing protein
LFAAIPVAGQTATVDLKDPAVIEQGSGVFAKSCAVGYCHGSQGRPARGPDLRARKYETSKLYGIVHDGIPNTTMPGWKNLLPERGIWAVVAYVMTLSGSAAGTVEVAGGPAARELTAREKQGRELFFDLNNQKRCAICHKLGRMGSEVGPNLALSGAQKSEDELLREIKEPGHSLAPGFEQTVVVTAGGERVTGIGQERTDGYVKVFDTASIPPPLRTFYRDQIRTVETAKRSSMPAEYSQVFSDDQLRAIVAYLKSGAF